MSKSPPLASTVLNKKGQATTLPVADLRKEAAQLIREGLHIRYSSVRRDSKLKGPIDFVNPAPSVAPVKCVAELVPKYMRRWPEGWDITTHGFTKMVQGPDAARIARLVNAECEDLGVYRCVRRASGWHLEVEF